MENEANEAEKVRARLQRIAKLIENELPVQSNGDKHGFIVLIFTDGPDAERERRLEYASNCDRVEVLKAMQGFLSFAGRPENFAKHTPGGPEHEAAKRQLN